MEVIYPSSVTVEINGMPVKGFRNLQVKSERTLHEVKSFGESRPIALVEQGTAYRITCSRLSAFPKRILASSISFLIFLVTVQYAGKKAVYSGCEWLSLQESVLGEPGVAEEAVFLAFKRTEEIQHE